MTQPAEHHGAELKLDPLRHAEPMKFVAENVSQYAIVLSYFGDDTGQAISRSL